MEVSDEIAFQANILALNAAVGAARAAGGPARSVQPVADEVHSPAQGSAQALKEQRCCR